jgi:hypothetical protein
MIDELKSTELIIHRATCAPNAWTFKMKPVKELLDRYVGDGKGWVDMFAGDNSPAECRNDWHPERKSEYHMDAQEFCKFVKGPFIGVIFDPPYSYRQISEHYKETGRRATSIDTSANFYNRVMNAICDKINIDGYAISFGWNSSGFGRNRGFVPVELLILNHGASHHNDTLCLVENRIDSGIKDDKKSSL